MGGILRRLLFLALGLSVGCDLEGGLFDDTASADDTETSDALVCIEPVNPLTGSEPAWEPEDELMLPADVSFTVTVDMLHPSLEEEGFQPKPAAVKVTGDTRGW